MTAAFMRMKERERERPRGFFALLFQHIYAATRWPSISFFFLSLALSLSPYTVSFRTSQLLCVVYS